MTDYADAASRTTREQALEQHPNLDADAPAASEETPEGNQVVFAQTPEEVQAQIDNAASGHDTEAELEAQDQENAEEDDGA